MKALPIYVFRNDTFVGCSNCGISEKYDKLLLVCDDGYVDIDESNPPENLVHITDAKTGHKRVEPVAHVKPGFVGWMDGGAIAYCSDSRFANDPLKIHDRQESRYLYDLLSM